MTSRQRALLGCLLLVITLAQASSHHFRRQQSLMVMSQGLVAHAQEVEENEEPLLIAINIASAEELQLLPGIGPVYAENIIAEREKSYFTSGADLLRVRGIGPARLAAIEPLISFQVPDEDQ